ncbi:MAG: MFS transporter [Acidobacteriota bacterium]|nr:MFS transporter [Acidobacteriota bacterium]
MSKPEGHWLNRTVWGLAWTSFLSDLGHEGMSTLLPSFLAALGLPPLALGFIEGVSDAVSSFLKLGAGWISDRMNHRKPFVVAGYAATGFASGIIAAAPGFWLVFGGKLFGWAGRGLRGPLRDALLTDAIPIEARGRAFGFHRFGDTLGAILGPLGAVMALGWLQSRAFPPLPALRWVIFATMLPGLAAAVVMAAVITEKRRVQVRHLPFRHALAQMPSTFRRYLLGVGLFGMGDFARTLLILAAAQLLTPALGIGRASVMAGLLFVLHNTIYALSAYPAGSIADRVGHRRVLGYGYLVFVLVPAGLLVGFHLGGLPLPALAAIFALAGFVNGVQDTLEGAATADLAPEEHRGLAFGLLGSVNGVGDLFSSLVVGGLWTLHPTMGFGFSALMALVGAVAVLKGASLPDRTR